MATWFWSHRATLFRPRRRGETEVFCPSAPKYVISPARPTQGWIASADCNEVRIPMDAGTQMNTRSRNPRKSASVRIGKTKVVRATPRPLQRRRRPCAHHRAVTSISSKSSPPNSTFRSSREKCRTRNATSLYDKFRKGAIHHLMVSKVGGLRDRPSGREHPHPDFRERSEAVRKKRSASAACSVPKEDGRQAHFYTLVTQDSREQEFAMNCQLFLTEQRLRVQDTQGSGRAPSKKISG